MSRKRSIIPETKNHPEPLRKASATTGCEGKTRPPFQNISADILIEIFLQAIPTKDDSRGDKDSDDHFRFRLQYTRESWSKRVPVNVSAVCRHWRAVALSSPILWSTFIGYDDVFDTNGASFPWEYLDMFLLRSRNVPFNLTINLWHSRNIGHDKLVAVFRNDLAHVKTVDIAWTASSACHIELARMPSLETLRLRVATNWVEDARVHVHLEEAPLLRHLCLTGLLVVHNIGQLSFGNLTHISLSERMQVLQSPDIGLRDLSWHDCLLIMQVSPSLEAFSAETVTRRGGTGHSVLIGEEPYTIHPKLTLLDLRFNDCETIYNLLNKLCLPGLTELSLTAIRGELSLCGLRKLLSRSEATLRKLSVNGIEVAEVAGCLEYMPDLQMLSISRVGFRSPGLSSLILRLAVGPGERLCPDLESIRFRECGNPSSCSEELTAMIFSRWDRSMVGDERRLKSVTFQYCPGFWDFPYSDQLLAFCREGLVVEGE